MEKKEEYSLVAVVRVTNRKGEDLVKPVKIYKHAVIGPGGEEVIRVCNLLTWRSYYLGEMRVTKRRYREGRIEYKEIPLSGVYAPIGEAITVDVQKDSEIVIGPLFPVASGLYRKSGEKEYHILEEKIALKEGESLEWDPWLLRDIRSRGDFPSLGGRCDVLIKDLEDVRKAEDVKIIIEARREPRRIKPRELTKKLYQPTGTQ